MILYFKLTAGDNPAIDTLTDVLPTQLSATGVVWAVVGIEHVVLLVKMALRAASSSTSQDVLRDQFREECAAVPTIRAALYRV